MQSPVSQRASTPVFVKQGYIELCIPQYQCPLARILRPQPNPTGTPRQKFNCQPTIPPQKRKTSYQYSVEQAPNS